MAYTVPAADGFGEQTYTIGSVIRALSSDHPPLSIKFPLLEPREKGMLGVREGGAIPWGSKVTPVLRSFGLLSCASVCYVNTNSTIGYVFHANSGEVQEPDFRAAMRAIGAVGPPYNTVSIAYAHPGDGADYQDFIASLVEWGVPANHIVEITNLAYNAFGLNNDLQIGY